MLMNLRDLLAVADKNRFAVPAFNIGTGQILKAVMDCCAELRAPVILAIHPSELEFQGDSFLRSCREIAHTYPVPCCIHLDHGTRMDQIYRAVRTGFTSVMIDASRESFEDNAAITKRVVELCRPLGISVEAELGTIGSMGNDRETGVDGVIYTRPGDARRFVEETGCDCLAVAIGTAHGLYPSGYQPALKLDLLREIKSSVSVPLVLHGGSSNPDSEMAESVKLGISKINISSDIKDALYQALRRTLAADPTVREPFELYPSAIEEMKKVVRRKIALFNDEGKTSYYRIAGL